MNWTLGPCGGAVLRRLVVGRINVYNSTLVRLGRPSPPCNDGSASQRIRDYGCKNVSPKPLCCGCRPPPILQERKGLSIVIFFGTLQFRSCSAACTGTFFF